MAQTNELPLLHSEPELLNKLGALRTTQQSSIYTFTLSINFGFMAGLADTAVGSVVLRIVSVVIAAGGFVVSLAVIVLAPMFPSLTSAAPPKASSVSSPLGEPLSTSSPHLRSLRRRHTPALIAVSVRRDPNIVPIIERRDSTSPSPAPPSRRVSFSPQSSSTSVPTLADFAPPSQPGSSNGHAAIRRVQEHERESGPAYILPTPPASITSVSSEADDTETAGVDEFGASCSPAVGKRGKRSFTFSKKGKGKAKAVPTGEGEDCRAGLFGSRPRAQSLGFVVESNANEALPKKNRHSLFASTPGHDEVLRESEGETTSTHDDRASRTSGGEKEARRRSGLSFQDFKAAFGKRERRSSAVLSPSAGSGSYALSSSSDRTEALPSDGVPRTGVGIGIGRPSTAPSQITPRSASDELAQTRRANSPPLRLDTTPVPHQSERKEAPSPVTTLSGQAPVQPASPPRVPLFNGEVVIRNESGRRRTRTTAIPGLYTDGEVVRRW